MNHLTNWTDKFRKKIKMNRNSTVYISRTFNASKNTLFKWLTQPDSISKWFGPRHLKIKNVENELRLSGNYSIELLKPDGTSFFISGTYTEIIEPDSLKFSFRYIGLSQVPPESIVHISLEEISPTNTKLFLIQKFETVPSDIENRAKAWENMFEKLVVEIKQQMSKKF